MLFLQEEERDGEVEKNEYEIEFRTEKSGTYKVTYDIIKDGVAIDTEEITVYAYASPVKSVTVDGKNDRFVGNKKTGKVKVTLASGNKIQKLEVGTFQKPQNSSTMTYKMTYQSFKNGASVKFGATDQILQFSNGNLNDTSEDGDFSAYLRDSLFARTFIRVTYIDKYTKQTESTIIVLRGFAK